MHRLDIFEHPHQHSTSGSAQGLMVLVITIIMNDEAATNSPAPASVLPLCSQESDPSFSHGRRSHKVFVSPLATLAFELKRKLRYSRSCASCASCVCVGEETVAKLRPAWCSSEGRPAILLVRGACRATGLSAMFTSSKANARGSRQSAKGHAQGKIVMPCSAFAGQKLGARENMAFQGLATPVFPR